MDLFKVYRRTPLDKQVNIVNLEQVKKNTWRFDILATDRYSANQLLRIISTQIPSFALGDVYIDLNTSYLNDETLSHRIGQIPVVSNISMMDNIKGIDFNFFDNSNNNFGYFELFISTDPISNRPKLITSSDLVFASYPPDFDILDNNIVIGTITPGQEIIISASVQLGAQSFPVPTYSHPKWNPVVNTRFIYDDINNENLSSSFNTSLYTFTEPSNIQMLYKTEIELLGNVSISDVIDIGLKIYQDNLD